jgi:hypothetical protein
MKFISPDPQKVRVSEDGRYLIHKRITTEGKSLCYELWKYELVAYGFETAAAAVLEAETIEATGKPTDRASATLASDGRQFSPST